MSDGVNRHFGYPIGINPETGKPYENVEAINEFGVAPEQVLTLARAAYPPFNVEAEPWTNLQDQGSQGSCQGHALAHAFQVAMVQKYGKQVLFSRGGAYYLSQRFDGIGGDKGSTLRGGQQVANSGLCLEKEWPYPSRYNNQQPASANGKLNFTMPGSKTITDADLAWELLAAGVMIQTGVAWTMAFEQEVSDRWTAAGNVGGHSTLLYGLDEHGRAIHHNSWGRWMGDMRSLWTKNFFSQILRNDRWAVFVAYDSTNLVVPDDYLERI